MLRIVALLAVAGLASACSRRRNFNAGNSGSVTIGNPNWPASVPPTPQPTPPPPPPPLPTGWATPAWRENGGEAIQTQTRKNCQRRAELVNTGTEGEVEIEEVWVYDCNFMVCLQTDIGLTDKPQNCGCSLSYARQAEPNEDMYEAGYSTSIESASIVSYDVVRNQIVGYFDGFRDWEPSQNLTDLLRDSAMTATMDYSQAMAAFTTTADAITEDKWPKSLDASNPENLNNIPALCFDVKEQYQTKYRWPKPPVPVMSQQPNIWKTNCIPWTFHFEQNFDNAAAKRQDEQLPTTIWWREFMTFPIGDTFATTSGFNPAARLLRSFYRDSQCTTSNAFATFDHEFRYQLSHETVFNMIGAFSFFRQYKGFSAVGGAPKRIVAGAQMQVSGFAEVQWTQTYSATNGAYRKGVFYNALLGTPEVNGVPFIGATEDTKLCLSAPAQWEECDYDVDSSTDACKYVRNTNAYGESAFFYTLSDDTQSTSVLESDSLDCRPAYQPCSEETTFLSAINDGMFGRDFTFRADSLLAVGPREGACLAYPRAAAFDSITFEALQSGAEIKKRGSAQVAGAAKRGLPSHIKYAKRQDGSTDERMLVAPTSAAGDPALGAPELRDVFVQSGGGSADENGLPTGDHPVELFAETYAVPVTMDPEDIANDVTYGRLLAGQAAPCIEGTKGCTCRSRRGRPRCDAPLTCSSTDEFPLDENEAPEPGFCQLPSCLAGEAGCECSGNDGCENDNLECSQGTCVYKQLCTPGQVGCKCDENDSCSGGFCNVDKKCIAFDCPEGLPGCECRTNEANNEKYCFAEKGYTLPLTVVAVESHTGANGELSFQKDDEIVIEAAAGDNPRANLADPVTWTGKLGGATGTFPASKTRVPQDAAVDIVNAYVCEAGTICSNPEATGDDLGAPCMVDSNCKNGNSCVEGFCSRARCEVGSAGCSCTAEGACNDANAECSPGNICLTPTCTAGDGGCECSQGRCRAGFECSFAGAEDTVGRCVVEACDVGTRGCPCKQESNGDLTCSDKNFNCVALNSDGSDKRCIAQGTECGSQVERCIEYCGEGKVEFCPRCSDGLPVCTAEVKEASAAGLAASMAALVALIAVALF